MKKLMKKLLLACVTAAVLISCFCVAASAEVGNGEISDILEYYDATKTFAYDTFDSAEGSERLEVTDAETTYRDSLAVVPMSRRSKIAYSVVCAAGNIGVNFRFRMEGTDAGNLQMEFAGDAAPRVVLSFDFADTKSASLVVTDRNAVKQTPVPVEGLTLTEGTFYSVSLFYTQKTKTVSLTVADGTTGDVYSVESLAVSDLSSVSGATLRLPNKNNDGVTFSLDMIEVYTGSFARSAAEKQEKTEEAIVALVRLYNAEDTTNAQKEELIRVIHTVLSSGFTAEVGTPAYEALYGGESLGDMTSYAEFSVTFFTAQMIEAVEKIDTEKSYADRLSFVDEMNTIHAAILSSGVEDPDDGSEYAKALEKYHAESAAVEKIRTDAEKMIAAMNGVFPTRLNYEGYASVLDALDGVEADATYPGITDALSAYDQVVALKTAPDTEAQAFLTAVSILSDTELTFAPRYAAYATATSSYYEDETFFLTGEGGEKTYPVPAALALYGEWSEYFDGVVSYSESFLSLVARAVYATELSSRISCIMDAEAMMKDDEGNLLVETGYLRAGTAEEDADFTNSVRFAIDKITEMNETLESDRTAIADYIAAVNRMKNTTDIKERKAMLPTVRALRVAEDLLTVDGVVEANITFSAIEAEVALWEGNSKIVLNCAEALKTLSDLSERAARIVKARAALATLTDKTYDGVSDAEAVVLQAVKDYNSDIALVNEMFERETDAALEVSYAAAPKTIVGVIAWITKENY